MCFKEAVFCAASHSIVFLLRCCVGKAEFVVVGTIESGPNVFTILFSSGRALNVYFGQLLIKISFTTKVYSRTYHSLSGENSHVL